LPGIRLHPARARADPPEDPLSTVVALFDDLLLGSNVLGMLRAAGHEARLTGDATAVNPDGAAVLIVDLASPGFDGVAVVEALRAGGDLGDTRTLGVYSHVDVDTKRAPTPPASTSSSRARAWRARARSSWSGSPVPDVLRPLFDQVVIKELEPDRMRRSGLLVPEGTSDVPPNEGIVLAAGGGPPELPDFKMPVKPGDHVVFPRSAGVWVEIEDERLLVCRVREILGVIESTAARSPRRSRRATMAASSPTP
jgi:chaperonin GroES